MMGCVDEETWEGACKAGENTVEGSPRVLDPSGRLKLRKVAPTQWLVEGE